MAAEGWVIVKGIVEWSTNRRRHCWKTSSGEVGHKPEIGICDAGLPLCAQYDCRVTLGVQQHEVTKAYPHTLAPPGACTFVLFLSN